MIKINYLALTAVAIVLFVLPAYAFTFDPGETGGTFLKIGTGAAPTGMGEAYTALSDDVDSIYWNPAGLAEIENIEMSFMHLEWFQGIRYENVAYAQSLEDFGTVGGSITYLFTEIEGKVGGNPQVNSGDWDMKDGYYVTKEGNKYGADNTGLTLSYAYPLSIAGNRISLGGNLKGILERIDEFSALGGGADLGAIYNIGAALWYEDMDEGVVKYLIPGKVGLMLQNLGMMGPMQSEGAILPVAVKLGLGYNFAPLGNDSLLVGLDLHQPMDNITRLNMGSEYKYTISAVSSPPTKPGEVEVKDLSIAGRVGYKLGGNIQRDLDALAGLSGGIGVGVTVDTIRYELDYTIVPYGMLSRDSFLSSTHRLSLKVKLGPEAKKKGAIGTQP